jgi:hypothetical protein
MKPLWDAFCKLGAGLRWVISVLVILVVALFAWRIVDRIWPEQQHAQPSAAAAQGFVVPVSVKPSVSRKDPSLPDPRKEHSGRTELSIPDTVLPGDSVGTVHWIPVTIVHNSDPSRPPLIFAGGRQIMASYQEIRDPRINFELHLHAGASGSIPMKLSPWAGVSFVTFWSKVDVGAAADFYGLGVFGTYPVYEILEVQLTWQPVRFDQGAAWRAGVALKF